MTDRPTIGDILMGSGRVTREDVERALEYQRAHGGYFGEALVACGLSSESEVEWGLASQYDLPFVFPEADSVDYGAASIVSPEWALAHLTLPIIRTDERLTVIVDSPLKTEPVEELQRRTQLEVEVALASPTRIRELIREVYARASAAEEDAPAGPVDLTSALAAALGAGALGFGISVRGARAWAWWDDAGTIRRRPLSGDWLSEMDRALDPAGEVEERGGGRHRWSARLSAAGTVVPVEVLFLGDESGTEWVFHPRPADEASVRRFAPPPPGIVSEVRLLARTGRARFVLTAEPPGLGRALLPHLPDLLFDPGWRSIYVHAGEREEGDAVFSHGLSADPRSWPAEIEALAAFHFDVATVDLVGDGAEWPAAALDVAAVAFVLWPREDLSPAHQAGVRWHLHVARGSADELEWSLEPLPPEA